MHNWLVLLPPVFVLMIAFFTHNILVSILVGVASAGLIAADFSLIKTGSILWNTTYGQLTNTDTLYMIGFAFILGAIIMLIEYTGGTCALGRLITRRLKNSRDAQTAPLIMSCFLCIDDYLSSLTNGCLMQAITDKFRIARAKLAFLINTMASPLVVLIPISSWIAIIVKNLKLSGLTIQTEHFVHEQVHLPGCNIFSGQHLVIQSDPFYTYLKALPFFFYSFIVIAGTWFIVRRNISYGPMKKHEDVAQETGNLYAGQAPRFCQNIIRTPLNSYLSDFFVPVGSLIVSTVLGLVYNGGYYLFGGTHTLLDSFKYANIFPVLFYSSCISFILGCLLALIHRTIAIKHIPLFLWQGFKLMYQSCIIISCALVFGELLNSELCTGAYLAQLILPYISIHWIPFITFIATTVIAMGAGSSWGTLYIMFPISIQMTGALTVQAAGATALGPLLLTDIYILLPTIGAVVSGSIAGAQLSPIADPVTISSTSAGAYQIDHVRTQMPYIMPAIIGTCISFIAAGFLKIGTPSLNALLCLSLGLATSLILLLVLNKNRTR